MTRQAGAQTAAAGAREGSVLVEARGLRKEFHGARSGLLGGRASLRAVDGVDLDIATGETVGLVGESGSGKSTLGRILLRLSEASAGTVRFDGTDLGSVSSRQLRRLRAHMQMVFQDPFGSLDPRWRVRRIIAEPLIAQGWRRGAELNSRVAELLNTVGLEESYSRRLPTEMSGGQRQRVGIARAIAVRPRFIVADEPVSALDVSVQAQILNLLSDLQERFGITYLLVAHGLNVVRHISTRVVVMYLGRIVESAVTAELYENFAHPYTASLMSAVLTPEGPRGRARIVLPGEVASATNIPRGCRFHTRCPLRQKRCEVEDPPLRPISTDHTVACHFPLIGGKDRLTLIQGSAARKFSATSGSGKPLRPADEDQADTTSSRTAENTPG